MNVQTSNGAIVDLNTLAYTASYSGTDLSTEQWTDGTWIWQTSYTYDGSHNMLTKTGPVRIK